MYVGEKLNFISKMGKILSKSLDKLFNSPEGEVGPS